MLFLCCCSDRTLWVLSRPGPCQFETSPPSPGHFSGHPHVGSGSAIGCALRSGSSMSMLDLKATFEDASLWEDLGPWDRRSSTGWWMVRSVHHLCWMLGYVRDEGKTSWAWNTWIRWILWYFEVWSAWMLREKWNMNVTSLSCSWCRTPCCEGNGDGHNFGSCQHDNNEWNLMERLNQVAKFDV